MYSALYYSLLMIQINYSIAEGINFKNIKIPIFQY